MDGLSTNAGVSGISKYICTAVSGQAGAVAESISTGNSTNACTSSTAGKSRSFMGTR